MEPSINKSAPFSLNNVDWQKLGKDATWFALVPMTFYIAGVLALIQETGHILTFKDFVPTNATMIAIITWILNQVLNLIRKYVA